MTIPELLVKDGYWPTENGPKGYSKKPQYPWEGELDIKTSVFLGGLVINNASNIVAEPLEWTTHTWSVRPPTVACTSTEQGVMT